MPVYKRAARPTAAPASADPRDPQSSENEFTVLFDRMPARTRNFVPVAPVLPVVPKKKIERPAPPPRLPVAERRSPSPPPPPESRGGGIAVPAVERIETVLVRPRLRRRALRVTVFLALGTVFGLGIELGLRSEGLESWQSVRAGPRPAAAPIPPAELQGTILLSTAGSAAPSAEPVSIVEEKALVTHAPHHHHAHHAVAVLAMPESGASAAASDAGSEVDDLAAAVEALTKAKEEVTLP